VEEATVDDRDTLDDPQMQAVADRLASKFIVWDGVLTADEVDDVVRESAESLLDGRVQTFVPLIAEHKAKGRLRELARKREGALSRQKARGR